MKLSNYMGLLLLVALYFIGLLFQLPTKDAALFVKEIYLTFFLLMIAAVGLFSVASRIKLGWLMFIAFFAIGIINSLYLHMAATVNETLTVAMVVLSLIGIVYSVYGAKRTCAKSCKKEGLAKGKATNEQAPKTIIIEDLEQEKPVPKKKTTKRKKTAKKKKTTTKAKKTASTKKKTSPTKSSKKKSTTKVGKSTKKTAKRKKTTTKAKKTASTKKKASSKKSAAKKKSGRKK